MNTGERDLKNRVDTTIMFNAKMLPYTFKRAAIDRIRFLRVKAGLTNADLSCILGKADNYISQIENEDNTLSIEILAKVLNIFRLTPAQFFSDSFFCAMETPSQQEKCKQVLQNWSPVIEKRKRQRRKVYEAKKRTSTEK